MITKIALCAREVVRDAITNQIYALGIFEGLTATGFPLLVSPFTVLFLLEKEESDHVKEEARFELLLGTTEILSGASQIDFEDKQRTRQVIRLEGLVISGPGTLHAKLWRGEHLQAEYSFQVEAPVQPQVQMTTTSA